MQLFFQVTDSIFYVLFDVFRELWFLDLLIILSPSVKVDIVNYLCWDIIPLVLVSHVKTMFVSQQTSGIVFVDLLNMRKG